MEAIMDGYCIFQNGLIRYVTLADAIAYKVDSNEPTEGTHYLR